MAVGGSGWQRVGVRSSGSDLAVKNRCHAARMNWLILHLPQTSIGANVKRRESTAFQNPVNNYFDEIVARQCMSMRVHARPCMSVATGAYSREKTRAKVPAMKNPTRGLATRSAAVREIGRAHV